MRSALAAALAAIFTLGPAVSAGAQQQNLENVQVRVQPVQGNVYLLAGAGGNITLQIGRDGVLMVDTEFGPLAQKIMTEVRKLSKGPIRYIINTHVHPDHVGGNEELAKLIPQSPQQPLKIIVFLSLLLPTSRKNPMTRAGILRRARRGKAKPAMNCSGGL